MKKGVAFLALRSGLAFVFLWFGIDKFIEPAAWVGWIPSSMYKLLGNLVTSFVYGLGLVETVIGLMLATGIWLRAGGWAASAILVGIIVGTGWRSILGSPEIVRDFGLLGAALFIALREREQ